MPCFQRRQITATFTREVFFTLRLTQNSLLNNKHNNITTDLTDDTTTHKILNGHIVKILEEGTNINIKSHPTKLVINSTTDLSNYYTQTEVNSLLNNKQDSISSTGNFKVYEHSYGLYSAGVLSHTYGLQFAVSSSIPPATHELIMTKDASTGVAIANSLDVSNNLQVHGVCTFIGNVSAPNLYNKPETDNLLNTKQDELGLFNDNTKIQLLNTSNVLKSLSAGSNIVLTNDVANSNFVEMSANLSSYYTQTEVNNLLSNKQDLISSTGNFKVYEHSYGLYSSGVLSHTFGLQFAVSSTVPPSTNQLIMTMDSSTGVAIAHSLDVSDNLQVHGVCTFISNVSAPNLYNKNRNRQSSIKLRIEI